MIWLTWKLLTLPIRLVFLTLKVVLGVLRVIGPSRILAFGGGVVAGLSIAKEPGEKFRARLFDASQDLAASGGDLAATVRYELGNSPRTWHLPQPKVTVDDGRVILEGTVAHDDARHDLIRTAGAIAGVRAVDDRLVVEGGASDAGETS